MNTKLEYRATKRAFSSSARANVIACSAFTLTLCSTSPLAADSTRLEEVVVSGFADPRMGSLLTSTEIRTTSADEQITLPLSIGSLAGALEENARLVIKALTAEILDSLCLNQACAVTPARFATV